MLPGLSLQFGQVKLEATCVMRMKFQRVSISGVWATPRMIGEIAIELLLEVASCAQAAAFLVYFLARSAAGEELKRPMPAWVALGQQNFHLLPWLSTSTSTVFLTGPDFLIGF